MTHSRNKSGAFKSECHQVLHNPWLYIAMFAVLGVLISDSYDPLRRRTIIGEYPRMYNSPERYSITIMFGIVLVLLSRYLAASHTPHHMRATRPAGMLRYACAMRCGRLSGYVSAKFRATFMSGALSLSVPVAIYIVIIVIICGEYRLQPGKPIGA